MKYVCLVVVVTSFFCCGCSKPSKKNEASEAKIELCMNSGIHAARDQTRTERKESGLDRRVKIESCVRQYLNGPPVEYREIESRLSQPVLKVEKCKDDPSHCRKAVHAIFGRIEMGFDVGVETDDILDVLRLACTDKMMSESCSIAGDLVLLFLPLNDTSIATAANFYRFACSAGIDETCYNIKFLESNSSVRDRNIKQSRDLLGSCFSGDSISCVALATRLIGKSESLHSRELAHRLLRKACISGKSSDCVAAGDIWFQLGMGDPYSWQNRITDVFFRDDPYRERYSCSLSEPTHIVNSKDRSPTAANRESLCYYSLSCQDSDKLGCLKFLAFHVGTRTDRILENASILCDAGVAMGCMISSETTTNAQQKRQFEARACKLGILHLCRQ